MILKRLDDQQFINRWFILWLFDIIILLIHKCFIFFCDIIQKSLAIVKFVVNILTINIVSKQQNQQQCLQIFDDGKKQ